MNLLLIKIIITLKWNMLSTFNKYQFVSWIKIFTLATSLSKLIVVWAIYKGHYFWVVLKAGTEWNGTGRAPS